MSVDAIFEVTDALRLRLESAVGDGQIYVGPPVDTDVGERRLSLFLFHIQPNKELRNADYLTSSPNVDEPLVERRALPLDLRFLISVFRVAGNGGVAEPNELNTLGQAMQELHAEPTLTGPGLPDQTVRLTPEAYPMEELSRVWGLFPQTSYRTSVVYLASPVFVASEVIAGGPPVVERTLLGGISTAGGGV